MYEVLLSRLKLTRFLLALDVIVLLLLTYLLVVCEIESKIHSLIECGYAGGIVVTFGMALLLKIYIEDSTVVLEDVLRSDVRGMLFSVFEKELTLPAKVAALLPLPVKGFWLDDSKEVFERVESMTDEELRFARDALTLFLSKNKGSWRVRCGIDLYMLE